MKTELISNSKFLFSKQRRDYVISMHRLQTTRLGERDLKRNKTDRTGENTEVVTEVVILKFRLNVIFFPYDPFIMPFFLGFLVVTIVTLTI